MEEGHNPIEVDIAFANLHPFAVQTVSVGKVNVAG